MCGREDHPPYELPEELIPHKPDEACNRDDCGHTCWLEGETWTKDVSIHYVDAGDVDGEGPCTCEWH